MRNDTFLIALSPPPCDGVPCISGRRSRSGGSKAMFGIRISITVALVVLLGSAESVGQKKVDKPKDDKELLQGTWKVVASEAGGRQHGARDMLFTFQGEKFFMQDGQRFNEGTFALDARKEPKTIDLTRGEFVKHMQPGIYRFSSDKLTLHLGGGGNYWLRPIEFGTGKVPQKSWSSVQYVLERDPDKSAVPKRAEPKDDGE